ncbi:MAG: type II secretion system F family protein [Acidimicrobiia bacterium]
MRWVLVIATAGSILALGIVSRRNVMSDRIAQYIDPRKDVVDDSRRAIRPDLLASLPWIIGGAFVGVLLAQGDLFVSGAGRSVPALAAVGGMGGWFLYSARRSSAEQNRTRSMRFEIPVVADSIAMQVVSGESVSNALSSVVATTRGAVSDDLASVLEASEVDESLPDALLQAARSAPHPDVRRLYETLAHAHSVGGRLNESLAGLAVDFRATLERDLTAEGGRRAITSYGPVIALMIPTALLFLLYPTLLGLQTLAGSP